MEMRAWDHLVIRIAMWRSLQIKAQQHDHGTSSVLVCNPRKIHSGPGDVQEKILRSINLFEGDDQFTSKERELMQAVG